MALAAAGPLILLDKQVAAYVSVGTLFFIPAVINAACVLLSGPLPRRPEHLPEDHADRPSPEMVERLTRLLTSNRWLMLASYTAMFLLAPLVPEVFKQLQVSAQWAPALSGLLDVVRVAAFALLFGLTFWHGRAWPAVMSMLFAPAGFLMILFGNSLAMVLAGEVLFGLSAGIVYYAALYYAMAVKNASVEGGGAHEGLIGGGFAIGPALGLVAVAIAPRIGGEFIATLASVGPFFILCSIMAARPLVRRPRS